MALSTGIRSASDSRQARLSITSRDPTPTPTDKWTRLYSSGSRLLVYFYFLKDFIYLFSENGEGREKERKRNIDV